MKWLLGGLLALLSVWTLFHLEATIWPFAAVATVAIVGTMLYPALPGRVPRVVVRLAVPAIALVAVLDLLSNEVVLALVRLNAMLVMYRAITYRERRDDLQLIALSLFLVVLTGVLTVSLVFVAQILLFTGVGMMLLFVINILDDALAGAPVHSANWVNVRRQRLLLRLRQAFDFRMAVLGLGLFLAVVLVSALIFVAIPRFEVSSPIRLFSLSKGGSLTGFADEIALGDVTDLKVDDSVAMRIDLQGGALVPREPYWRMVALDEYDNGAFRVSQSVRDAVGDRSLPYLDLAPLQPPGVAQTEAPPRDAGRIVVFMEPGVSRFLPQPGGFSEIQFKETQEIVTNELFQVYATRQHSAVLLSYQILGADFSGVIHDGVFARDRVYPSAGFGRRAAPRPGGLGSAGVGTRMPAGEANGSRLAYPQTTLEVPVSPEARAYLQGVVAEITAGEALDAATFAQRACAYLARTHPYAMQVRLPPSSGPREDPVIRWMQAGAGGHCEFFAAAFALIARTAGHPVRVITGFKGGTWNGFEGYFMVRHSDAHAWCEVFDGRGAWLRVDPTPGAGALATITTTTPAVPAVADRSTAAYLDSLRMLWYRRIVNFDQRSQQGVTSSLKRVAETGRLWVRAAVDVIREQYTRWQQAPFSGTSKGDLLLLAVSVLVVASLMRRLGWGKNDVFEWLQRSQVSTRQRAGVLLRRLEERVAHPPRRASWDEAQALQILNQLTVIRYGRAERWPETLKTFRAARRML